MVARFWKSVTSTTSRPGTLRTFGLTLLGLAIMFSRGRRCGAGFHSRQLATLRRHLSRLRPPRGRGLVGGRCLPPPSCSPHSVTDGRQCPFNPHKRMHDSRSCLNYLRQIKSDCLNYMRRTGQTAANASTSIRRTGRVGGDQVHRQAASCALRSRRARPKSLADPGGEVDQCGFCAVGHEVAQGLDVRPGATQHRVVAEHSPGLLHRCSSSLGGE